MKGQITHVVIVVLLLSLLAGAVLLGPFTPSLFEINGVRYEIPRPYTKSSGWSSTPGAGQQSGGYDSEGPSLFVYFSNEELATAFPDYVSKFGERGFKTRYSVMVFKSDRIGTFEDDFLQFFPRENDDVSVEYDLRTGLYQYSDPDHPYEMFIGTVDPYRTGFESTEGDTFIRCLRWPDSVDGSYCRYFVKIQDEFIGFRISYANLHLYQELQDFFFEKLESWRVE